jgi:hypothetical protein
MKKAMVLMLALLSAPAAAVNKYELAYCGLVKATAQVQILNRMTGTSFDDAEDDTNSRYWDHSFYKMAYKIMVDAYETEIPPTNEGKLSQSDEYPKRWYNACLTAAEANYSG